MPYAGDQWYLHRQKDAEGQFFWKVAQQGHYRNSPEDSTRQGIYIVTADARLLASDHFRPDPRRLAGVLRGTLGHAKRLPSLAASTPGTADTRYLRTPPPGGIILNVFTRIGQTQPAGGWTPNHATARDHVWLTREEWGSLLPQRAEPGHRYPVPPAIAQRLIRFHLVDNVRGEPPFWTPADVRTSSMTLRVEAAGRLALEGAASLQARDGARGYEALIQGHLAYEPAARKITRLDLLSWGDAWGAGPYTRGAPPGRFPLLVAFSLAGDRPADRVPPQACRETGSYFGTGR